MKLINCRKQKDWRQFDLYCNRDVTILRLKYFPEDDKIGIATYFWRQKHRRLGYYKFSTGFIRRIKDLCRQKWGPE